MCCLQLKAREIIECGHHISVYQVHNKLPYLSSLLDPDMEQDPKSGWVKLQKLIRFQHTILYGYIYDLIYCF